MRAILLLLAACLMTGCPGTRLVVDLVPASNKLTETVVLRDGDSTWKIAMIDVTGLIIDADPPPLIGTGENPVSELTEALRKAEADKRVRAVVLRVNSPGGTVTASDVMYREIMDFKSRTGKPVVVLMSGVAASGGYYVACAGDEIIAHPTTITGSIGVIIQTFNFSDGLSRIGIRADAITSGPNKAVGSPWEPMSPEHRALLQGLVDEFYANFLSVVTDSRKGVAPDDLDWITDGRVVSGERAASVGLVDRVGDIRTAFEAAQHRANLTSARLVKYHRPLEYVGSAYAQAPVQSQINLMQLNVGASPQMDQVGFYYLWDPSISW